MGLYNTIMQNAQTGLNAGYGLTTSATANGTTISYEPL
jgi:hypothetical protein